MSQANIKLLRHNVLLWQNGEMTKKQWRQVKKIYKNKNKVERLKMLHG